MNKTYIVRLTDDERQELSQLTKSGKAAASKIKHAHILLHVDANGPNWSDAHVATALHCHGNTVRNVRQRFVEQGVVYLSPTDKYHRLTRRLSQEQKGLDERALMASQRPSEPW